MACFVPFARISVQDANFDENVACEDIVCICHRQHCAESSVQHDEIEILFFRNDFLKDNIAAGCDRQEHNNADHNCQKCFQRPDTQFVAPGRREMTHHKCVCFLILHNIYQQNNGQNAYQQHHKAVQTTGDTTIFDQWCDDTTEHREEDAEERYIMYEIYMMLHIIPLPPLSSFA